MYIVTVKFISSTDLLNAITMAGIAGKYMFEVSGLRRSGFYVQNKYSNSVIKNTHLPKYSTEGGEEHDDPFLAAGEYAERLLGLRRVLIVLFFICEWGLERAFLFAKLGCYIGVLAFQLAVLSICNRGAVRFLGTIVRCFSNSVLLVVRHDEP